ncbi:hypothetical protein NM688_g5487 [Phlebia brevispora]|uniref:Uncharacterized protein n=1 Tax=Phlebia brevispora TaxID=194682 RepID=A0ACC1SUP0_9APHY|nr:hypothetical protein NM688_g5487 [Phlebia brevispora]
MKVFSGSTIAEELEDFKLQNAAGKLSNHPPLPSEHASGSRLSRGIHIPLYVSVPMDSATRPLTRHPSLYLKDGDVAITAQHSDGSLHVYRIDKAFLSRFSPVFADMFAMPNPSTVETYDGAPVVHLTDRAEDVEAFLAALYDPSKLILPPRHPDNPVLARPLLTLSKKYDIRHIYDIVKQQLARDWPCTFEEYEVYYATASAITEHHELSGRVKGKPLDDVLPEPASAIPRVATAVQ